MDKFDQLLKEKIEQKEYAYKASSWRKFSHQSGIATSASAFKIAAVSLATVGVLSTGGYMLYKHISPLSDTDIVPTEIITEEPVIEAASMPIQDTVQQEKQEPAIPMESSQNPTTIEPVEPIYTTKTTISTSTPEEETPELPQVQDEPETYIEQPQQVIEQDDGWRVVIINTDTIGSDN